MQRILSPMIDDGPRRDATYDDLVALPDNLVGELIDGELIASPRPASPHALASSVLGFHVGAPFHAGRGGPGGWVILDEPELHFGRNVLVPDLAGWRRERMPVIPDAPYFTLPPDWVCEVISPSTGRLDRVKKRPIYAQHGVTHLWFVNPEERSLEVFRLHGDVYAVVASFEGSEAVRAEPFDAIELPLGVLWGE